MGRQIKVSTTNIFLRLVGLFLALETSASVFSEHPADVTVMEGSDATFSCGTNPDLSCSFFYWGRYQARTGTFSYISKCLSSYESQYTILREGNVYSLHVHDVSLGDGGTVYECWQYSRADGGWLKSTNATLTVLPATTSGEPEPPVCQTNPPGPHSVGDKVSFECSNAGQTSVVLSWTAGREGSDFGAAARMEPGQRHTVEWTLTERDNFEKFICTAGEESTLVPPANCSVMPLAVPTNVTVFPQGRQTVVEGGDAVFRCNAQAVPEATSYTWLVTKNGVTATINPQHSQTFLISDDDSGRSLRVLDASRADDGIEVVCKVSNEVNITGRSEPCVLHVTRRQSSTQGTSPSSMGPRPFTADFSAENSAKNPDDLRKWSHMSLVIGIMLCVVVLFVAAGMGLLYARWRRRMNQALQESTAASPSPEGGKTFSLHDPGADLIMAPGCVPALPREPIGSSGVSENVYMEILGNQSRPQTPAPAHERAVENNPIYERHF